MSERRTGRRAERPPAAPAASGLTGSRPAGPPPMEGVGGFASERVSSWLLTGGHAVSARHREPGRNRPVPAVDGFESALPPPEPAIWRHGSLHEVERVEAALREQLPCATVFTHLEPLDDPALL